MKTEELKAQGLSDEQIKFVMAENGKEIEAQKALISAEADKLATANNTIQALRDTVKKFDGVDVEQLKNDLDTANNKYSADLAALKRDHALDTVLMAGKAKSLKAVKAILNLDEIKLDGDKLLGLDSQLEKLKADSGYMFESEQKPDDTSTASTGATHGDSLPADSDAFINAAMKAAGVSTETK